MKKWQYVSLVGVGTIFLLGVLTILLPNNANASLFWSFLIIGFLSVCATPCVRLLRTRFLPFAIFGLIVCGVTAILSLMFYSLGFNPSVSGVRGWIMNTLMPFVPGLFSIAVGSACTAIMLPVAAKRRASAYLRVASIVFGWVGIALFCYLVPWGLDRVGGIGMLVYKGTSVLLLAAIAAMVAFFIVSKQENNSSANLHENHTQQPQG